MADYTSCTFVVDDQGGGALTRTFVFTTIRQGTIGYQVTIHNDGINAYNVVLSDAHPSAAIPDQSARVQATGSLTLIPAADPRLFPKVVQILFDGILHTTHPLIMQNCIVASFG